MIVIVDHQHYGYNEDGRRCYVGFRKAPIGDLDRLSLPSFKARSWR
jgi:hypothetical protein